MAKNQHKNKNVFKVAGAKSLKLKAKAKAVKSNLKNVSVVPAFSGGRRRVIRVFFLQIKHVNKAKVEEIDKALDGLQEKLRKSTAEVQGKVVNKTTLPTHSHSDDSAELNKKETIVKLEDMQL